MSLKNTPVGGAKKIGYDGRRHISERAKTGGTGE